MAQGEFSNAGLYPRVSSSGRALAAATARVIRASRPSLARRILKAASVVPPKDYRYPFLAEP
jgi:hypothetical protein